MSRCHRSKRPARRYKTQCAGSKLPRTPLCAEQATSPPVEQLVHWVWNFKSQRTFSTFSTDIGLVYSSFPQTFVLHLQLGSTDIFAITDSYFTSPHHNRILTRRLHSLFRGKQHSLNWKKSKAFTFTQSGGGYLNREMTTRSFDQLRKDIRIYWENGIYRRIAQDLSGRIYNSHTEWMTASS